MTMRAFVVIVPLTYRIKHQHNTNPRNINPSQCITCAGGYAAEAGGKMEINFAERFAGGDHIGDQRRSMNEVEVKDVIKQRYAPENNEWFQEAYVDLFHPR